MKILALLICSRLAWSLADGAEFLGPLRELGPNDVQVQAYDPPLPKRADQRGEYLWEHFLGGRSDFRDFRYTTAQWREHFQVFAAALGKKAEAQQWDAESLLRALDLVREHACEPRYKMAYLPVAVWQGTLRTRPVWIIAVIWESDMPGVDEKPLGLAPVRAFIYDQKTLELKGFNTCM